MRVGVDPGHGGRDPGAVANGLREKDITLQVAKLLSQELTERGHVVHLTRQHDVWHTLEYRARVANNWKDDIFVSLHCNAAARSEVEGMEIFSFPGSEGGFRLAGSIFGTFSAGFLTGPHRWRGLKEANFAVLRLTHCPAVLVEMEFITNEAQAKNLADPAWQLRMAKALAEGIGA